MLLKQMYIQLYTCYMIVLDFDLCMFQATVQKVLKRIEDVHTMCGKKRAELVNQSMAQPVQHPAQAEFVTAASRGSVHASL